MAIEVSVPDKPVISVNGEVVPSTESQNSDTSFTGSRTPTQVSSPASITMTGPDGATIRYTFNSMKVNYGSKEYSEAVTVRENGDGFDSDTLTIRAKSYINGEVSGTNEVVVKLV